MPVSDVLSAVKDHIDRAPGYDLYRDYEEGRHKHPYATPKFRRKFGWILKQARLNTCYTVRSNFTDLVQIQAWSGAGADAANTLAETTDLDMVIDLTVNEAFRCGDGYILVWPGKDGEDRPWYHRADQVGYRLDPEDPSTFEVVWKIWVERDGYGRVNLYYPDRLERWVSDGKARLDSAQAVSWDGFKQETAWAPFNSDGEPEVQLHDFGRVPWVHIPFDPQTQGGHGRSILRDVVPLQDGLNHAVHAVLVNTEKYADSLRALMNHQPVVTIDPATGKQREERLDVDETRNSIVGFRGEGPLVQLTPPDASNILSVKRDWMTDIAITAGIPISDVAPDLGNIPSGVSLRVLATRRTNTVRAFTKANTGRLSLLMELLGVPGAIPEWIDAAPTDDTERLANAQARLDLGYPLAEVLPDLGEDVDDIDRILEETRAEQAAAVSAFRARQEEPGVMGDGEP